MLSGSQLFIPISRVADLGHLYYIKMARGEGITNLRDNHYCIGYTCSIAPSVVKCIADLERRRTYYIIDAQNYFVVLWAKVWINQFAVVYGRFSVCEWYRYILSILCRTLYISIVASLKTALNYFSHTSIFAVLYWLHVDVLAMLRKCSVT